jgi:hypothetical protein
MAKQPIDGWTKNRRSPLLASCGMEELFIAENVKAVKAWAASKKIVNVDIDEDRSPKNDELDDYCFAWQMAFTPKSLNKARLTVSITTYGNPSILVETWDRIANRLNLGSSKWARLRGGGGFEPRHSVGTKTLIALCDNISRGAFDITAYQFFGRLAGCAIKMHDDELDGLRLTIGDAASLRLFSAVGLLKRRVLRYSDWGSSE